MIQDKTLKTKNPKVVPCRLEKHEGLPFPVFVSPQYPITRLKENYLFLYTPIFFSCNPKDSEK